MYLRKNNYVLSRRLPRPITAKGIYIIDGKKVVIK